MILLPRIWTPDLRREAIEALRPMRYRNAGARPSSIASRAPPHRQRGYITNPFRFGRVFTAESGAYDLTGTAATLTHGFNLGAASGSYALAGTAATLRRDSNLGAASSSYALTGTAATLTLTAAAVDAADFDGTNDYLSRSGVLSGAGGSDSKTGIYSLWLYADANNKYIANFQDTGDGWHALQSVYTSANGIQLSLGYAGGFSERMYTSSGFSASAWHHLLYMWDSSVGTSAHAFYLDDVVQTLTTNSSVDANTAWSLQDNYYIGAGLSAATPFWDGGMAEYYLCPGQYLAFGTESNRRKFISAAGKPVNLGTTGSTPTGTTPAVYLHLGDGESAANFATNRTGNGDFTVTGTLGTFASSPSD